MCLHRLGGVCVFIQQRFQFLHFLLGSTLCCVVKRLCKVKVNLLSYSNFKNIYGVAKSMNMKSIFVHLLAVISIWHISCKLQWTWMDKAPRWRNLVLVAKCTRTICMERWRVSSCQCPLIIDTAWWAFHTFKFLCALNPNTFSLSTTFHLETDFNLRSSI